MYQVIRERLVKKGHLRKFVDNLSSHRNKILESLNFNYKLTTQTKEIERHFTGLLIADSIMEIIYPVSTITSVFEDKLYEDSYISSGSSNKEQISKQTQNKHQKQNNMQFYQDSKANFDEQYFKIMLFLFENQKRINLRLLESLSNLCRRHPSIISCEAYVWRIINKMTDNISKNIHILQSCELLYLLLIRTKDQTNEQLRNHQSLECLIMTWLKQKQDISHSRVLENHCYEIIKIYFSRCISSWDSLFLYQVMFRIYDNIQFGTIKLHLLEMMLETILKGLEMKDHFLRGLFNYLIGYLCINHDNIVSQSDKKWFSMSLGLVYDKMRLQYKNILKDSIKVECFKLLNRWINKQYININDFCLYNSQALVFLYISNVKVSYKNSDFQQILQQYFKIIGKLLMENKRIFMERVLEQFKQENVEQNEAKLLLQLAKQILFMEGRTDVIPEYSRSVINNNYHNSPLHGERNGSSGINNGISPKSFQISNHSLNFPPEFSTKPLTEMLELFLIPIPTKFCPELKLNYLRLIGFVLSQGEEVQLEQQGKQKLCEFLTSIYANIIINNSIGEKYQFVCTVISVIRVLLDRYLNYRSSHKSENCKNNVDCQCLLNSFVNKTIHEVKQLRNSHMGLIIEAQYMVYYLISEIQGMLLGLPYFVPKLGESRKQGISVVNKNYNSVKFVSEKDIKQENDTKINFNKTVRSKMEEINSKIKPLSPTQSANNLPDLVNQMYEHLQKYHREGESLFKQSENSQKNYQTELQNSNKKSQEQKQQYKEFFIIFQRLFASNGHSKRRESQNNILNRHRMNSRDSEVTSHFSLSNNPHRETSKTNRFSDTSFDEVIDIMHI